MLHLHTHHVFTQNATHRAVIAASETFYHISSSICLSTSNLKHMHNNIMSRSNFLNTDTHVSPVLAPLSPHSPNAYVTHSIHNFITDTHSNYTDTAHDCTVTFLRTDHSNS